MGVVIRWNWMKLPKSCGSCPLIHKESSGLWIKEICPFIGTVIYEKDTLKYLIERHPDCPLEVEEE